MLAGVCRIKELLKNLKKHPFSFQKSASLQSAALLRNKVSDRYSQEFCLA